MTESPASPIELDEPPAPARHVLTVGLFGVGLVVAAFALGCMGGAPTRGFDTHKLDGIRALLSVVGLLVAGCAVSMRPGWFGGWLCGAGAGLIGYGVGLGAPAGTEWQLSPPRDWLAGMPNSWDSVQLFFGVAGIIGLIGAAWTFLPRRVVFVLILLGMAYHFAGILSAITSPPPTPYLTDQYWKRIARPYLQFAYMNNAYQFYSPDPGPACEIWACIEYREDGTGDGAEAKKECVWAYIPRRAEHYKDPLGLAYYRRLSLTENIAQYQQPGFVQLPAEQMKVTARRDRAKVRVSYDPAAKEEEKWAPIPRILGRDELERRVPNELITRQVLPSYAHHIATAYARPGWTVQTVKLYRAMHMIMSMPEFRGYEPMTGAKIPGRDPYNAAQYLPYFQGEFDRDGKLIDSTDPMLYWLVPIVQVQKPDWSSRDEYRQKGGFHHYFVDYVSRQAGCERPVE